LDVGVTFCTDTFQPLIVKLPIV